MQKQSRILSFIIIIGVIAMIWSCNKKDDPNNPNGYIPNVPVNFYINPNTIDYIPAGSWRNYNNEGHRGVIIYRIDQFNFMAYERTCPYDPDKPCAQVEVDPSSFTLIDSCCMSRYNIIDGMPVSGPSSIPLKQYFTEFDGNLLHIYNSK